MLRKLITGSYNFAKVGNRQVLLRAAFVGYRKRANNDFYWLEANQKRVSISISQYWPRSQRNDIFKDLSAHENEKNKEKWKVTSYVVIATAIIGYLLIRTQASADEEGEENEIESKRLQSKEHLDKISTQLAETLPGPVENYVDLEGKREFLDQKLKEKEIVVISGAGGMGKSTLAVQYGNECKEKRDTQVIWIKGAQIEEEFFRLAEILSIETKSLNSEIIRNLVYGNLQGLFYKKRILLIFDNVETREKIEKYLINLPTTAKVIITARNGDLLEGIKPLSVKGFNKKEAFFYLKRTLGKNEEEIEKIINTVSESPFRLSIVVAYFKSHPSMSVGEFIAMYLKIKEGHSQNEEIYPEARMLFKDLQSESPKGWELLKYLAYLDAEGVTVSFIAKIMGQTVDELNKMVNELRELSLIKIKEGNEMILKTTHRIVQDEMKKALIEEDETQVRKVLKKLIEEVDQIFPYVNDNPEHWRKAAEWIKHAETLTQEGKKVNLAFIDRKSLLSKIGDYSHYIKFNYHEAINCWKELLDYQRKIYPCNHPEIAVLLNNIGTSYTKLGGGENLRKGLQYLEDGLKMNQSLFPGNYPGTAYSLNKIGSTYEKLGGKENLRKGLQYLEDGLKMNQSLFPGNHPDTAYSLNNIGSTYTKLGGKENLRKGLQYYEDALNMLQVLFPGNHPDIAFSLNNIGSTYTKLGGGENLRKSLQYYEDALKMNQALFSGNHPGTAYSLNNIGLTYTKLGGEENLRKGLQYSEDGLKMHQTLFPGNHPGTVYSLNNIGSTYAKLGGEENLRKSLQYYEDALKMNQALFPDNYPGTAYSLNNIGSIYAKLGGEENLRKGLQYYEDALKMNQALFPDNYPGTAYSLNNIGSTYAKLGGEENLRKGLQYYEDALKMNQALFPGNYLDTAYSLNKIGSTYAKLGGEENLCKGLQYLENGLKMHQALFPGNHSRVAVSLYNLGFFYQGLDDENKALEYMKQAYSIYSDIFDENHEKTKSAKLAIQLLQPNFFENEEQVKKLKEKACLGGNSVGCECRWVIITRRESEEDIIKLKYKLQRNVLNNVVEAVEEKGWSNENWPWSEQGVKGYLEKDYLGKELGTTNNKEIETAQMLCFESMNLGIMKSEKKPYDVVQEFTRNDPGLVKKIAQEHPEFFVDGSIVEACVKAVPDDASFKEHILKHVKYMGMEARQEWGYE